MHPGMIYHMPHLRILPFSCSGLVTRLEHSKIYAIINAVLYFVHTWQLSCLMPVFWQELAVSRNTQASAMRDAVKG